MWCSEFPLHSFEAYFIILCVYFAFTVIWVICPWKITSSISGTLNIWMPFGCPRIKCFLSDWPKSCAYLSRLSFLGGTSQYTLVITWYLSFSSIPNRIGSKIWSCIGSTLALCCCSSCIHSRTVTWHPLGLLALLNMDGPNSSLTYLQDSNKFYLLVFMTSQRYEVG